MNLLLDTNVLIDYLGRKPPFFQPAQKLVAAAYFGDANLWVPAQSLKDAYYVLSHYVDQRRVQQAMSACFEIIRPASLVAEDAMRAAKLAWDDYEDCLVALCAARVQADYIITRDAKGFQRSLVPVMTPTEWLDHMFESRGFRYEEVALET